MNADRRRPSGRGTAVGTGDRRVPPPPGGIRGRGAMRVAVALAGVVGVVGLSACAPGTGATGTKHAAPSGPISTDPAKAGTITLTEWDQNTPDSGMNEATEALNKAFHEKYPNVTIKRVSRSFQDLKTTLKLALSSNNPPDVVQAN